MIGIDENGVSLPTQTPKSAESAVEQCVPSGPRPESLSPEAERAVIAHRGAGSCRVIFSFEIPHRVSSLSTRVCISYVRVRVCGVSDGRMPG